MSDTPDNIDLAFIGRAVARLTSDVASLHDDVVVLTAIVMRMDGTLTSLLAENRATHSQLARLAGRVRVIEEKQT